jgi:pyrimidine operon attenuation protein/uracil phosphoribosyltransferase
MITQGLLDAVASGEVETQHQASIMAAKNQVVLVGGLARVKGKTEAQFLAAARYLHLYECAQIGPMKATDYSQVRVDTSGPRQDQISASQDDSRAELEGARKALGARAASIVDQVVVFGRSVRALAEKLGMGQGGQARRRLEKELLDALDVLVGYFKLLPAERAKSSHLMVGDRLPL